MNINYSQLAYKILESILRKLLGEKGLLFEVL